MRTVTVTRRKLLTTGYYTYLVTLPREWIRLLRWQSGRKVELTLQLKKKKVVLSQPTKDRR